ncbi:MAG: hypothetical protein H5U21_07390 [Porphyrobacter sp.]|nr:hypothetical protein [Porphyrobacter sp.]
MTPHAPIRRIGWLALLALAGALCLLLHFKVQAIHSEVVRAERRIVALEQDKLLLQTEFETRANQQQLAAWNQVDFGYTAPTAAQFLNGERQLAALGASALPGGAATIRFARADIEQTAPAAPAPAAAPVAAAPVAAAAAPPREVRLATATLAAATAERVPLVALASAGAAGE